MATSYRVMNIFYELSGVSESFGSSGQVPSGSPRSGTLHSYRLFVSWAIGFKFTIFCTNPRPLHLGLLLMQR